MELAATLPLPASAAPAPAPQAPQHESPMFQLSSDSHFHFEILRSMAYASSEGADLGEILVAANRIKAGDFESYYTAYHNLATRVNADAQAINRQENPISARQAFFRASNYYRSADFFLHGNWADSRINALWEKQRAAFDAAIALLPVPGKRITLNSRDGEFQIPAIFYGTTQAGPRPTILLCNGYDGSQEEMYHVLGHSAIQRGINVITYEGPGQPTVRREQNIGFIHDWERVVSPVIDWALTRDDVDPNAIAAVGYSFGGYLVPRAAAMDSRITHVFAVDGLFDFNAAIFKQLQPALLDLFNAGEKDTLDTIMTQVIHDPTTPTTIRWAIQQGLWSFNTMSTFEYLEQTFKYSLADVASKIKAKTFVADVELERFFPGQAQQLADAIGSNAIYHQFKAEDGAGEHCSVGAGVQQAQVVLDWFLESLRNN